MSDYRDQDDHGAREDYEFSRLREKESPEETEARHKRLDNALAYTITLTVRHGNPLVLTYDHRSEAMDDWDRTVDNMLPGDRAVLRGPKGILSEYNVTTNVTSRRSNNYA